MIKKPVSEPLASSRRVIAGYRNFLRSTKVGVRFGVRCGHLLRKPLMPLHLGVEPVAGFGLCPRFRYEENMGFPSENQEQFGLTQYYSSLLFQYFHRQFH